MGTTIVSMALTTATKQLSKKRKRQPTDWVFLGIFVIISLIAGSRAIAALTHASTFEVRAALRNNAEVPDASIASAYRRLELSANLWPYDIIVLDDQIALLLALSNRDTGSTNQYTHLSKALSLSDKLVKLGPKFAPGWARRAILFERMSAMDQSVEAMKRSLQISQSHPWAAAMQVLWSIRNWHLVDQTTQVLMIEGIVAYWKLNGMERRLRNTLMTYNSNIIGHVIMQLPPDRRQQFLIEVIAN